MLCKLLKYDFKSMLRTFLPLWGLILITAIVQTFLFNTDASSPLLTTSSVIFVMTSLVLNALLVGTFVLCTVLIIQRFYKGLLRDEGYLMFTLPVHPWQLVLSKLIVAVTVCIFSGLVALGSWAIFMLVPFLDILSAITLEPTFVGLVAVTAIFYIAQQIARIYLSISIGHLFHKHRIATAFFAYILLQAVFNQISLLFFEKSASIFSLTYSITGALGAICPYVLAAAVVELSISFFATQLILSRRLNLE